jgi:hypothetical protein
MPPPIAFAFVREHSIIWKSKYVDFLATKREKIIKLFTLC